MERPSIKQPKSVAHAFAVFVVCALVVAAFVIGNQSAVHWRSDIADDHLYSYGGWRIWQGGRPYLDVWDNKPPGIWWANALGFSICGEGIGAELLVCSAALLVAIAAFVGAARQAYGRGIVIPAVLTGAVLLTHMRYECGANRTETYVTACGCMAVYGYARWLRTGRAIWLILAGLAGGAAPLFKQNGIAAAAACGAHLLWIVAMGRLRNAKLARRRRVSALAVYFGALAFIPAIVAAYLAAIGALKEAWFAVVEFNRYFFLVGDATWIVNREILARYTPVLSPLREILGVAVLGLLCGAAASLRRKRTAAAEVITCRSHDPKGDSISPVGVGVFWLWLAAAFYLACVGTGRMAYHLAPALAPLGLLALYPLARFTRGAPLSDAVTWRPSSAAALVVYAYVLLGVLGDSAEHARKCWLAKPTWTAVQRSTPAEYELQAAAIRAWTSPSDKVYVWGWSPGTYRFAYRRCPSRYATIEHVSHVAPYGDFIAAGARRDIRRNPPAVFVISIGDCEALSNETDGNFATWFHESYTLRETIAGMRMFVLRE